MPANYRVEIRKSKLTEQFSNDYLIFANNQADAIAKGNALVTMERQFHTVAISFDYVRVSTLLPGDRSFQHTAINLTGIPNPTTPDYWPLFNTCRVDLTTIFTDPARKYYRLPLHDADVANGIIDQALRDAIKTAIENVLFSTTLPIAVYTPRGNQVTGVSVHAAVQERQQHRRRKKKVIVTP